MTEHVAHAYALTGHGTQGATVEWAAVVGRPSEFTAEWAHTALSRGRAHTELHVIAEPAADARDRMSYGPVERGATLEETLANTARAMSRRQVEPLALEQLPRALEYQGHSPSAESIQPVQPEPSWRQLRRQRERLGRGRHVRR